MLTNRYGGPKLQYCPAGFVSPNANDTQIGLRYISQNIDKIEYSRFSHKPFALYSVLPQLTAALDRQHTLGTIT